MYIINYLRIASNIKHHSSGTHLKVNIFAVICSHRHLCNVHASQSMVDGKLWHQICSDFHLCEWINI